MLGDTVPLTYQLFHRRFGLHRIEAQLDRLFQLVVFVPVVLVDILKSQILLVPALVIGVALLHPTHQYVDGIGLDAQFIGIVLNLRREGVDERLQHALGGKTFPDQALDDRVGVPGEQFFHFGVVEP
ncbi:hypothetical protein SDC9_183401 [bioreactor metagenome]|uniref:Uncharacterized protein n=1 Tax=bioreactor metagenome TaxID=1076179 RepID=A0A645HCP7_9ZZZZ